MIDSAAAVRQLSAGGKAIVALLESVDPDQAAWQPEPKSWSLLLVAAHLLDEEREDFRQRIDYTLHRPGESWPGIDPEGWVIERGYAERDFRATVSEFEEERARSLSWLDTLREPDWNTASTHPVLGKMHAGDFLASWVAHDLLHLRQIEKLRLGYLQELAKPFRTAYAGSW